MKEIALLLGFLMLLTSCAKDALPEVSTNIPDGTNLRINFYRVNCSAGVVETKCYLVQYDHLLGGSDWEYFYNHIEGFDYQEGYVYNLKVRRDTIPNPGADQSSYRYHLVTLLSKEKVKR